MAGRLRSPLSVAEKLAESQRIIGHNFTNIDLLHEALKVRTNLRLAAVGDRALDMILVNHWYSFNKLDLQQWAHIRTAMSNERLATLAFKNGLNDCILPDPIVVKPKSCRKRKYVADVMEAVVGAVYNDTMEQGPAAQWQAVESAMKRLGIMPKIILEYNYRSWARTKMKSSRVIPSRFFAGHQLAFIQVMFALSSAKVPMTLPRNEAGSVIRLPLNEARLLREAAVMEEEAKPQTEAGDEAQAQIEAHTETPTETPTETTTETHTETKDGGQQTVLNRPSPKPDLLKRLKTVLWGNIAIGEQHSAAVSQPPKPDPASQTTTAEIYNASLTEEPGMNTTTTEKTEATPLTKEPEMDTNTAEKTAATPPTEEPTHISETTTSAEEPDLETCPTSPILRKVLAPKNRKMAKSKPLEKVWAMMSLKDRKRTLLRIEAYEMKILKELERNDQKVYFKGPAEQTCEPIPLIEPHNPETWLKQARKRLKKATKKAQKV